LKLFYEVHLHISNLLQIQEVLSQKRMKSKHFERLWSFGLRVRFQQSKHLKKRNVMQFQSLRKC